MVLHFFQLGIAGATVVVQGLSSGVQCVFLFTQAFEVGFQLNPVRFQLSLSHSQRMLVAVELFKVILQGRSLICDLRFTTNQVSGVRVDLLLLLIKMCDSRCELCGLSG